MWKSLILALSTCIVFFPGLPVNAEGPMEGMHYERLDPVQPSNAPEGKVEIVKLFWYGCPHCYRFEPYVKGWLKQKSDNVVFTRVPAVLNPSWESHARFYYAAEALGAIKKLHDPLFIAIHENKQRLYKEEDLIDFAVSKGVDRDKFTEVYKSFAVSAKVRRAKKYGQSVNLRGVPAVVIDGTFITSASQAGSFEGVVYLMNSLPEGILAEKTQSEKIVSSSGQK